MKTLLASLRLTIATLLVCSAIYTGIILAFAQVAKPFTANGSLLTNTRGEVVGSRQIAQAFTSSRYFWPRPSAADYNGASAGGSNLAPTNPALGERAETTLTNYSASAEFPLPADLATASGSGLDPHISEAAARYQMNRISQTRNLSKEKIGKLIDQLAFSAGGTFVPDRIINVLELNLALDNVK
jgi:K+-transporting ATPase ATPase C chain